MLFNIEKKQSNKTKAELLEDFKNRKKQEIKDSYDELIHEANSRMKFLKEEDPNSLHSKIRTPTIEKKAEENNARHHIEKTVLPRASTPNQKLLFAMEIGDIPLARSALNDGASIHCRDKDGYTVFSHPIFFFGFQTLDSN